ncbi:hypothetical protein SEA_KEANU_82 [Streptomyces phage Keanu]|nr:hypothetical protein SEA_KEANU_82 [Streptomyces phage Keanu]
MNATFTRTAQIRSYEVTEGKVYEVHVGGEFWGWVAGENRSYLAMAKDAYEWQTGRARRTKAQAVEAAIANVEAERKAAEWRANQVPTHVYSVRLTAENIADEAPNLVGMLLDGGEDLGEIVSARLTRDGHDNATLVGSVRRDVLGLPCNVTAYRF